MKIYEILSKISCWFCKLNITIGKAFIRKTDLVTTVGPVTNGRPLVMNECDQSLVDCLAHHHFQV